MLVLALLFVFALCFVSSRFCCPRRLRCNTQGRIEKLERPAKRGGGDPDEDGEKFTMYGTITKTDATTLEVTELPVGTWTQSYKEFLESMLPTTETPFIKDFKEYHTDTTVRFVISLSEDAMAEAEKVGLEKKFKLTDSISTSNMQLFTPDGRIKRYTSPLDVLNDFFELRKEFYCKRKVLLLFSCLFVCLFLCLLCLSRCKRFTDNALVCA